MSDAGSSPVPAAGKVPRVHGIAFRPMILESAAPSASAPSDPHPPAGTDR